MPSTPIRVLTRRRILLAFAVAGVVDVVQVLLGPFGWTFIDEIMDVAAMILLTLLLGFHPLFLPTLIVEFVPIVDWLPTWVACVAAVVTLRRKQQSSGFRHKPPPPDVIDV